MYNRLNTNQILQGRSCPSHWLARETSPNGGFRFYLLITSLLIIFSQFSSAQFWEHTYGGTRGFNILETYDKGFAILGTTGPLTNERIFLLKNDINGNILWTKTIGNGNYLNIATGMDKTNDAGLILCGITSQYDSVGGAFVLKLNECGDKQWCKIYGTINDYGWAQDIFQLSDSSYVVLAYGLGPSTPYTNTIRLMKLDADGNVLWLNDYSHFYASAPWSLSLTNDNGFMINGYCWIPNSR